MLTAWIFAASLCLVGLVRTSAGLMRTSQGLRRELEGSDSCCCEGYDGCCYLGDELTGTITNKTGEAVNMPDTVTMTYQAGPTFWVSNTFANPCPSPPAAPTAGMTLDCDEATNVWTLIGANFPNFVASITGADCTALTVSFSVVFTNGGDCVGTFDVTFTFP